MCPFLCSVVYECGKCVDECSGIKFPGMFLNYLWVELAFNLLKSQQRIGKRLYRLGWEKDAGIGATLRIVDAHCLERSTVAVSDYRSSIGLRLHRRYAEILDCRK